MAMLISKFHRLIRSKLVWGAFLVVVIFTFVVWGTAVPQANDAARNNASPGSLHGEPVDAEVFRRAYLDNYLAVILSVGRVFNITAEINEQLRSAAWQRIISLDEAKKLGLSASDAEVGQAIQQQPIFHDDRGQFVVQGYKQFVNEFLSQIGFTEKDFEEYIRGEIVLQKLRAILARTVLIPPMDVRRTFSSVSDRFKIEYVRMGEEFVKDEVKVTDADVRAFFDKDPTLFTIPEKARVEYVRIPVTPFIPKVKVTEEDIETYYNENLDEFLRDTNEVAAAMATNIFDTVSKYKPLDEVRQEISNALIADVAAGMAVDRALEFIDLLAGTRDQSALPFAEAAAKSELKVETPEPFTRREEPKGVDEEAAEEFVRAAFDLAPDSEVNFSDPIRGDGAVYVLRLVEKIASRVPTFDEVADDVRPIAEAQTLSDALGTKAKEFRDAAEKAVKEGKTFADAAKAFNLSPVATDEFTASTGPTTNDYNELLMRGIMTRNQGEVTEILPGRDAVLVAYVQQRLPGDPATFDSLRQQIEVTIRRQNTRLVYDQWQEDLLKAANFEDRQAIPEEELQMDEELNPEDAPEEPAATSS